MRLSRRSLLKLPLLMAPAMGRAATYIPPFPLWVGRTALLRGDTGSARLLLAADGTGTMAVRLLFICSVLPIRIWQMAGDGMSIRYSRVSALDSNRLIMGEAHILRDEDRLLWIEAARHIAEFEGFVGPDLAGRCS